MGGADPVVILKVATVIERLSGSKFAFLADDGVSPGPALREILGRLAQSIVASASSSSPQLVAPTNIPGVIQLMPI